jgi:hypothetical protein
MEDAPVVNVFATGPGHCSRQQAVDEAVEQGESGSDDKNEKDVGPRKEGTREERCDCQHQTEGVSDDVEGEGVENSEFSNEPG